MQMMRLLYVIVLLFFTATFIQAQTFGVAPAQSNPGLRSYSAKQDVQKAALVERMTGINPLAAGGQRGGGDCPPDDFLGNLVITGDSIVVEVDTFGLSSGDTAILSLLNAADLQYGTAHLDGINLVYLANAGLPGAAAETVLVEFSDLVNKDTIAVGIQVVRKGGSVVASPQIVEPESVTTYCLDNELNFTAPKACSQFIGCAGDYDGGGQQLFHFSSYNYPDTCLVYYATRFPGTDTVCVLICDELTICDTFKIPIIVKGDTLKSLPLFDDFSNNDGPYPATERWLDKSTYVNTTFAKDPPSTGFATFDGLSKKGRPYDIISGVGDRLTSKAIDLSAFSPASDITLKFSLAAKGYGLEPETVDSFIVEFRNDQREWVRIATFLGIGDVPLDSFPPFVFHSYRLDDDQFFHKAFQFRFTGFLSPGGFGDLWHVDYVRLSANEGLDHTFSDVAFTELPTAILKNYTAMPWWHFDGFEDAELQDSLLSHFYNHFELVTALGASEVNFIETTTGQNFNQSFTVVETGQDNNMAVKTPETRVRVIPGSNFSAIKQKLKDIPFTGYRNLRMGYNITVTAQTPDFEVNDEVILNTPFDDYFAHDDGTAEWQVFVKFADGNGQQMAARFHANVDDSLRAVRLMFPHVNGDVQNQLFNLKVWVGSLDSEPVFERELLRPFYPSNLLDTLQGFTTYRLEDFLGNETPVFIPTGDFFVGWKQVSVAQLGIPVGFDIQNPCDCNFANITGTWNPFPSSVQGALMIRPVFGMVSSNTSTDANEVVNGGAPGVEVYPNPTTGKLFFRLKAGAFSDYRMELFNAMGQPVRRSALEAETSLGNLPGGVYFLRIGNLKTGRIHQQKVFLTK
jgi:type IX secretion system substrate protein